VASDTPAALRSAASWETLVQVTLAAPCAAAVAIAARVAGVSEPRLAHPPAAAGPVLAYRTPRPDRTNPEVIAGLVAAGAAIVSVTCTTATLEDVYATTLRPGAAPAPGVGV
jgi:hypothetical protein